MVFARSLATTGFCETLSIVEQLWTRYIQKDVRARSSAASYVLAEEQGSDSTDFYGQFVNRTSPLGRLKRVEWLREVCRLGEKKTESKDPEQLCQGVSPLQDACGYRATVHCATCRKWFCDAHAEDDQFHPCMLPPGDEGGEA